MKSQNVIDIHNFSDNGKSEDLPFRYRSPGGEVRIAVDVSNN